MNALKTTLLMAVLTVLLVMAGGAMGGQGGIIVAFVFALVMNGVSYWFSDRIVLRMYRAREVTPEQSPKLYRIVQELCLRGQLPMPRLYVIGDDTPNGSQRKTRSCCCDGGYLADTRGRRAARCTRA